MITPRWRGAMPDARVFAIADYAADATLMPPMPRLLMMSASDMPLCAIITSPTLLPSSIALPPR
jgi:hypothetical protein